MVLDLKAKLQKAQEALKVTKEVAKAVEEAAYERGVVETEARLTAEVTVICRDYCAETYYQTLDRVRVPIEILAEVQKEKKGDVRVFQPEENAKEMVKSKANANPSNDALTIEDLVSKAKAAESKSKIDSKKDSHQSQTLIQGFSFVFATFVIASCFLMQYLYSLFNEGIYLFI